MKIYGRGPKVLSEALIEEYYKYETSSKSFRKLPTRSLTSTTDAVAIDPSKVKKILGS
jgi:hypothetical protein